MTKGGKVCGLQCKQWVDASICASSAAGSHGATNLHSGPVCCVLSS